MRRSTALLVLIAVLVVSGFTPTEATARVVITAAGDIAPADWAIPEPPASSRPSIPGGSHARGQRILRGNPEAVQPVLRPDVGSVPRKDEPGSREPRLLHTGGRLLFLLWVPGARSQLPLRPWGLAVDQPQ
jgi:hypothetical protein